MSARLAVLCVLISGAAAAADTDPLQRAQTHFRAGKTLYDLGNFQDAIREFAAGYALAPRPEFLINLAQAYRRAGELEQSKEMFQRYLDKAPANARERPQVRAMIAELETELAARKAAAPAEPAAPDRPVVAALVPEPQASLPPPPPPPTAAAEVHGTNPLVWIIPVALAVVAAGVGVSVYVATRPPADPCAGAGGLGCFDLRPR